MSLFFKILKFSCYRLQLSDCRKQQELVRQYTVDFKELMKRERANSQLLKTSSGRTVKRRFSIEDEDLYTVSIVLDTNSIVIDINVDFVLLSSLPFRT